jgi:glucokinase
LARRWNRKPGPLHRVAADPSFDRRPANSLEAILPERLILTRLAEMDDSKILVGDVGGTHTRFAIVDASKPAFAVKARAELGTDAYANFAAALRAYLERIGAERPHAAAIAVAGPVPDGRVHFTNSAFRSIGPECDGLPDQPITILGAGTGLGVSCLARYRGRAVPVATEGGHMSFAPRGDDQIAVLKILAKRFGHVSIERVLSGPGIENIYAALEEIAGRISPALAAEDISERAEQGDAACRAAQDMFCSIYGAVAGDFALAHGARGGVYIAGGIAAKIEAYLQKSDFRARFEDKGRLSYFVKPIPTKLILEPNAAFMGAAFASLEFNDERRS